MKRFRTAFFMGYQKDEVDDFVEGLMQELERVRGELAHSETAGTVVEERVKAASEEARVRVERAQKETDAAQEALEQEKKVSGALRQTLEQERQASEALRSALADAGKEKEELAAKLRAAQPEGELEALREKIKKYENSYEAFSTVLDNAKREADRTRYEAQVEAEDYRQRVESELDERQRQAEGKLEEVRQRIQNYFEAMQASQTQIRAAYEELGNAIDKLPLREEDIASGRFTVNTEVAKKVSRFVIGSGKGAAGGFAGVKQVEEA